MKPRLVWCVVFLVHVVVAEVPAETASAAPQRPNVVVVFIDDMGWSDLSCFGGATTTEHIDRLAAEGLRFTSFYVNSPICSPSRVALTTGQYPQRWQISSYLDNRQKNESRGMAQWLDPAAPVLARQLKEAGYATGHFGKWHMGGQRDVDDAPAISSYGFDRSLTNFEGMGAKLLPLTLKPGWEKPRRIWQDAVRLGRPVTWMQRSQITAGFVDAAIAFIDDSQQEKKPFFVNLWPDDVHAPFFPPVEKWAERRRGLYHSVLDTMDAQLGALFNRICGDDSLRENTLILLCSDNGPLHGAGASRPLRGAKTWLYEGGVRSPLIVWGPGLIAEDAVGKVNHESVFSAIDVNRSLYEVCRAELPDNVILDGEDVSRTLLGASTRGRQAPICWRRPPDRPGFGHGFNEDNPDLAIRDGRWKYYENYDGRSPQLYNLSVDSSESNNLVESQPDVARKLQQVLAAWNSTMPPDAGDPIYVVDETDLSSGVSEHSADVPADKER